MVKTALNKTTNTSEQTDKINKKNKGRKQKEK